MPTSTRKQAPPRIKRFDEWKDPRLCHCEPVTDVTGAAIRSPLAAPCISVCRWGRGFPRQSADWLGMTGAVRVVAVCVSVVRPCGSMWASTPTTSCVSLPQNTAILCRFLLPCGGVRSPRPTLYRGVFSNTPCSPISAFASGGQGRPPLQHRYGLSTSSTVSYPPVVGR